MDKAEKNEWQSKEKYGEDKLINCGIKWHRDVLKTNQEMGKKPKGTTWIKIGQRLRKDVTQKKKKRK